MARQPFNTRWAQGVETEDNLNSFKAPDDGMRTAKSSTQPCKAKTWCALTFKWAPVLAF